MEDIPNLKYVYMYIQEWKIIYLNVNEVYVCQIGASYSIAYIRKVLFI